MVRTANRIEAARRATSRFLDREAVFLIPAIELHEISRKNLDAGRPGPASSSRADSASAAS
jgi:ribosomal protein L16/L10AE